MISTTQTTQLKGVLHDLVVNNSHMSAKDISKAIQKPYSTLLRESNPDDLGGKIGAVTLFSIMLATGEVEPLRWMAQELGYTLVATEAPA